MAKTARVIILIIMAAAVSQVSGQRITEVMYDPGTVSDYDLEWVEILNDTGIELDFDGWSLDGKVLSGIIPPGETLIAARNLADGEESFESFYGDGSGVWGDCPEESYLVCEAAISLLNSGDTVVLSEPGDLIVHSVDYDPSMGGSGNNHTLTFYSDGTVLESSALNGTPGLALHMMELEFSEPSPKQVTISSHEFTEEYNCGGDWRGYGFSSGVWDLLVENIEGVVYEGNAHVEGDDYYAFIETPVMETYPLGLLFMDSSGQMETAVQIKVFLGESVVYEGNYNGEDPPLLYKGEYILKCGAEEYLSRQFPVVLDGDEIIVGMVRFSQLVISEFSHTGECEWVELGLSWGDIPVLLESVSIHDLAGGAAFPSDAELYGRLVVTGKRETFQAVYPGCACLEITGMPQLNDGGDLIQLQMDGAAGESIEYDSSWPSECASLERISLTKEPFRENFYPADKGSPGERNNAEDYMDESRRLAITEVYPFGSSDFIEITVIDDGNGGSGCLVSDYSVSDMETSSALATGLCSTGDVILLETLSLYDYGDQVLLKQGEALADAMAYRKKYSNLTGDEREDMDWFAATGFDIVDFGEINGTLSFQLVDGEWILKGATAGIGGTAGIKTEISVERKSLDGVLRIGVETETAAEITVRLFDTGGFERVLREYFLFGSAVIELEHSLEKGLYIYAVEVESGGRAFSREGVFAVL